MTNEDVLKRRITVLSECAELNYNTFKGIAEILWSALASLESRIEEFETLDDIEEEGPENY